MVEVPITIACGNYDRTRAIRDGSGGSHKQTGTDDSTDAERNEVDPA